MEVPAEWERILEDFAALERENARLRVLVAKLKEKQKAAS